jgi:outer membrane protein
VKNLSLILNIILIIAVGYLYFDEFSDNDESEGQEVIGTLAPSGKLAYVNSDSLLANYNYYEEVAQALQEKRSAMEGQFTKRAQALQGQVDDYQRTYLNMTVPQARAVEEDLMNKRQELAMFQESMNQELMREEAEITNQLFDNLSTYLKKYGDENGLEIVFTFTPGSGLLYANEALDITDQVIGALNEEYSNKEAAEEQDVN